MFFLTLPVLGLFVVCLWVASAMKLIELYLLSKDAKYAKFLVGLYVVNAFYVPIIINYVWLQSFEINALFFVANIVFFIIVACQKIAWVKIRMFPKFALSYVLCAGWLSISPLFVSNYSIDKESNIFVTGIYASLAVVVPLAYYLFIKSRRKRLVIENNDDLLTVINEGNENE